MPPDARLNPSHPLIVGATELYGMAPPQYSPYRGNLAGTTLTALGSGTLPEIFTAHLGVGMWFGGAANGRYAAYQNPFPAGTTQYTVAAVAMGDTGTSFPNLVDGDPNGGPRVFGLGCNNRSLRFYAFNTADGYFGSDTSRPLTVAELEGGFAFVGRLDQNQNVIINVRLKDQTDLSAASPTAMTGTPRSLSLCPSIMLFAVNSGAAANNSWPGQMVMAIIWPYAISDELVEEFLRTPYAMFDDSAIPNEGIPVAAAGRSRGFIIR